MTESPDISALAAQLADPARARMLLALMEGRALTVSELGAVAGLGKAGASEQCSRLEAAGLLLAERQGRHKYLRLAGSHVARLIETMMAVAAMPATASSTVRAKAGTRKPGLPAPQTGPRDPALRAARLCYNHLAGALGVQVYRSLSARGYLAHAPGGLTLTTEGRIFILSLGLAEADLAPAHPAAHPAAHSAARAPLCRDCLDWSERQSHLGGLLGRLLLARFQVLDWLRRPAEGRALIVTPKGRAGFARSFPDLPLLAGLGA